MGSENSNDEEVSPSLKEIKEVVSKRSINSRIMQVWGRGPY